jgi:hypothetical protein
MVEATISRVRMGELARPGRFRPRTGVWLQPDPFSCAGVRFATGERHRGSSIATALPSRPGAASSRPGGGDLVASTIQT